jgi:uncharacterized delta-60 repeat protein
MMRLLPNGAIDTSFGVNGKLTITITDDFGTPMLSGVPNDIAIQQDGKIIVGGQATFAATPEEPGDGFGGPPPQTSTIQMFAMARLGRNGQLDVTFAGDGTKAFNARVDDSIQGVALLPPDATGKQKILVAGGDSAPSPPPPPGVCYCTGDFAIARLEADGSLDSDEFASEASNPFKGIRLIDFTPPGDVPHADLAKDIVLQQVSGDPNNPKIVVGGQTTWVLPSQDLLRDFAMARLCSNGDVDTGGCGGAGFGDNDPPDGKRTFHVGYADQANTVAIHNVNGQQKIVIAGRSFYQDPPPVSPNFMLVARHEPDAAEDDVAVEQRVSAYLDTTGDGDQAWEIQISGCKVYVGGTHTSLTLGAGAGILGLIDDPCIAGVSGPPAGPRAAGFQPVLPDGDAPPISTASAMTGAEVEDTSYSPTVESTDGQQIEASNPAVPPAFRVHGQARIAPLNPDLTSVLDAIRPN